MPQNNPQVDVNSLIDGSPSNEVDVMSLIDEGVKKKNGQSQNGTPVSENQSLQDGQPFKTPIEILNESGGNGSLFPTVPNGNPPNATPKVNTDVVKNNVDEGVKKIITDAGYSWDKPMQVIGDSGGGAALKQNPLIDYLSQMKEAVKVAPLDPITKLGAETYINSAQGFVQGTDELANAKTPIEAIKNKNVWQAFELPAALIKTGFGAASLVPGLNPTMAGLAAFNASIAAGEKVLPADVVGYAMSPIQTIRSKGAFVGNWGKPRIFDLGTTGDEGQAAAEMTDLVYQILLFHGAKELATKAIHNIPYTTNEAIEVKKYLDEELPKMQVIDKNVLSKIPETIPDEVKVKAAPIIQQKIDAQTQIDNTQKEIQDLETKKQSTDENFQSEVDKQISEKKNEIKKEENKIESANNEIKSIISEPENKIQKSETVKLNDGSEAIVNRRDFGVGHFEMNAYDKNGNNLGHAIFDTNEDGSIFPYSLQTKPQYQRNGVMRGIYDTLEKQGYKIMEGKNSKSEAGAAFEKSRITTPPVEENKGVVENVADVSGGVSKLGAVKPVSKQIETKLGNAYKFFDTGDYQTLKKKNVIVEFGLETLDNGDEALFINDISTEPQFQGKGNASKVLEEITNYADNNNMPVALRASIGGHNESPTQLTQEQLINWYQKRGFELKPDASNFGKDDIFMVREPKTQLPTKSETPPTVENKPQSYDKNLITPIDKPEMVSVNKLKKDAGVLFITQEKQDAIQESVTKEGVKTPIIINKNNGDVIDGSHRLAAAQEAGIKKVPVIYVEGMQRMDGTTASQDLINDVVKKYSENKPQSILGSEDIEKRRNEELKSFKNLTDADKGKATLVFGNNKIGFTTYTFEGKTDNTGAAFLRNNETGKVEHWESGDWIRKEINKKYDAELKALEVPKDITNKEGDVGAAIQPEIPKTKLQLAKEKFENSFKQSQENRKSTNQNLGIIKDPLKEAKKQAELDRQTFDDLVDYAREGINEGFKTLKDFVEQIPEELKKHAEIAWKVANNALKYEDAVKEVATLSEGKEVITVNPEETGIKNAVTLAERQAKGLDEVEVEARRSFGDAFEAGKKAVDSGKIDPRVLAKNLAKKPRALNAEESVALIYDRMRLQNEHRQVMDLFEEATKKEDEAGRTEAAIRLAGIEDAMLVNDEAARKTGYEQGLGLAVRRMMIRQDYSLSNILQRARVANDGKPIPDDVRARIEDLSKQRDKLLNKLEEYKATIVDLREKLATKPERTSVKKQAQKLADKVRGLKTKPLVLKDAQGNPIIVKESNFYNEAIELVAKSIELGGDIGEAIQKGIEHIRGKNFFNELSAEDKSAVEKQFSDHFSDLQKSDDAQRLEKLKIQLRTKSAEVGAKLMNADVEQVKKTKKPILLDEEARSLQAQVNKKQNQLEIEVLKLQQKNRTKLEKGLDFLAKWRRAVLLTSATTLGKLTSAATQRIITTPLEEIEGALISKIPGISKIAAKAPREGLFSAKGEAAALTQLFKKATYKDVWETAKTGRSQLDYLYGKQNVLPPTLLDFFGQLHGALKVTPKRAEFFRAFQKRTEFAIKNGVDVSDPTIQATIGAEAYIDANRSILMHDNAWTDAYKTGINYLQAKGTGGKIGATVAKVIFPIVKIPVNYVGEASSYAGGGLKALAQVIIAGGVDKLTPDQADYVMRNLKKQGIGAVIMAIGYLNADNIGGYYQQGERRSEKDAQAGGMKLFGKNIPRYLLHSPLMEMLQFGATIHRVIDSYSQHGKSGGVVEGGFQASKGLITEVPFLEEPSQISDAAKNAESIGGFLTELGSSMVVPPDVTKVAVAQDVDENGNPISRKPRGFVEHVKTKIPGLREQVPINEPKEWGQKQQSILEQYDKKPIATDTEIKKQLFGKTDLNKSEEDSFDLFKKKAKTVSEYGINSRELNLTKSLSGIISNKKKAEILKHYKSEKENKFEEYKKFALENKIISQAVIDILEGHKSQSQSNSLPSQ